MSSQRDAEKADIELEKRELASAPSAELRELVEIYVERGLDEELAHEVARQLSAKDRLAAHESSGAPFELTVALETSSVCNTRNSVSVFAERRRKLFEALVELGTAPRVALGRRSALACLAERHSSQRAA